MISQRNHDLSERMHDKARYALEAAVCAPSGWHMRRWRFLVIKAPAINETV